MLWLNIANIALQVGLLVSAGVMLFKSHRTFKDARRVYRDAIIVYTKVRSEVEIARTIEANTLAEVELLKAEFLPYLKSRAPRED